MKNRLFYFLVFLLLILFSNAKAQEFKVVSQVSGPGETNSYLIYCVPSKEAAIIDPGGPVDTLVNYIKMKKLFTLIAALLLTATAWGQSPEKMSYQAVIRNSSDQLVVNQMVGMQITILQGSETGTTVYMETQTRETNENGLLSLEIGAGNAVHGSFSYIDWSDGPYFIRTEADPSGGTNYTITGTSQILSVPYALHSRSADILTGNITENQITDLKDYLIEETDPHFIG
jgi:hypothetical protein